MLKNYGIGVDIVDVRRFTKIPYDENESFYKKNFHRSEIEHCLKYKHPAQHFAGKFAIKESVIKAVSEKISMADIETAYVTSKPVVRLPSRKNSKYDFLVSLSHEGNLAIAVVIAQKR